MKPLLKRGMSEVTEGVLEIEWSLCELVHLCAFVEEVVRSLPGRQVDEIPSAALAGVFGVVGEIASGARDIVTGLGEQEIGPRGVAARCDALERRLRQCKHLCTFATDLPRVLDLSEDGKRHRLGELRAESMFMVFGMVSDRLKVACDELAQIRAMLSPGAENNISEETMRKSL